MNVPRIKSMETRKYEDIPIDRIKVLNSRNRDEVRFQENIRSIKEVGLKKPIVVNKRYYRKKGFYDLVCGQGRYLAHKALGYETIPAEVINCTKKRAYLFSLVENIARVPPGTMWYAQEVKRMHESGFTLTQISNITGRSERYVRDYIVLVQQGEKRLIEGVDGGIFSITFALRVAKSDNSNVQNVLMDAYDEGIVNSNNFPTVRKIIDLRMAHGKGPKKADHGPISRSLVPAYSAYQLKADITKITKEKEAFVSETSLKENRLLSLLDGLSTLWADRTTADLLAAEGIEAIPKLKGIYHV